MLVCCEGDPVDFVVVKDPKQPGVLKTFLLMAGWYYENGRSLIQAPRLVIINTFPEFRDAADMSFAIPFLRIQRTPVT